MVEMTNAVIYPRAVMVHLLNTPWGFKDDLFLKYFLFVIQIRQSIELLAFVP